MFEKTYTRMNHVNEIQHSDVVCSHIKLMIIAVCAKKYNKRGRQLE